MVEATDKEGNHTLVCFPSLSVPSMAGATDKEGNHTLVCFPSLFVPSMVGATNKEGNHAFVCFPSLFVPSMTGTTDKEGIPNSVPVRPVYDRDDGQGGNSEFRPCSSRL
ncbi:uncharacterized protein LOC123320323 [Coccinella septempunctata]|uniref:uncharacterized protein LOC123320323 n=1 Tax=Coccinella septempunctata TaxID=41139 RepID=UPI001D06F04F|nr:uncharacterized protein LOC123320323 [Coccinella septempunctata]